MPRLLLGVLAVVIPGSASAFCGLYVTEPGQTVENTGSSVIYANHDGTTTLTLAADFTGDATSFGLLVPIPQAITADDVAVVDPALFDYLDEYTTPRLVTYPRYDTGVDLDDGGADTGAVLDTDAGGPEVVVEARFTVGAYEVAVLATSDAGALSGWLAANSFAAPTDRDGILQGYIDGGSHFLAARVALDTVGAGPAWLPPLQFSYSGQLHGLPIRIGTLSASGPQELIVYAITDADDGQVRIANYPEAHVADECLWAGDDLDAWYGAQLDAAFGGQAGWLLEYSIPVIGIAACDPCTTNSPLYIQDLAAYGWDGAAFDTGYQGQYSGAAQLTRLRVRYDAAQADEDLEFVGAGPLPLEQIRYIRYEDWLVGQFLVCDDVVPPPLDDADDRGGGDPATGCRGGCSTGGPAGAGALLLVAIVAVRQRRR
jgi:uncharacterized protein (TIGR03382 family)